MAYTWQIIVRLIAVGMLTYSAYLFGVNFLVPWPLELLMVIAAAILVDYFTAQAPVVQNNGKQKTNQISIIVPTYEEKDNLEELCTRIHDACKKSKLSEEIIIVDDNSNDGSVEKVEELQSKNIPVRIIVRTKERGLSSAVLKGFYEASSETLVCMDADLSHPPEVLSNMVSPIMNGESDFVIGSRYSGGGRSEHTLIRFIISMGASLLAFPLVPSIRDPMSGFFSLRAHTVKYTRNVNPKGFKIGLELAVKASLESYRIKEIPIVFKDRVRGASKLTLKVQLLYVLQLIDLYKFVFPTTIITTILTLPRWFFLITQSFS